MPGLVEIPEHVEDATAAQRARTEKALEVGVPEEAATPEQRRARATYISNHWPVLLDEVIPEGFVGKDDTLWSSFLSRGARCAKAVARVVWKDRPAESRWQGTAFLISDWVAVTNHHVLDSPDAAAATAMEFNYEYDEDGDERRGQPLEFDPDRLFLNERRDGQMDYAVVAVKPVRGAPPAKGRGFLPLIAERGKAQNGDPLNLIHHPAGMRKRITVRESRLLGVDEHTLHYSGDTLGGSSGAPVFNDQWEVIGLHFGGKPKRDANGRRLSVDGSVWDPSMAKELIAYEFNVGARISSLIRELRGRADSLAPDARKLLLEAIGESR
jgi:V8-like Glu-specific endopeptidase